MKTVFELLNHDNTISVNRRLAHALGLSEAVIYGALYLVKSLLPDSAFRIGFTNGLMSESMIIWFAIMLIFTVRNVRSAE